MADPTPGPWHVTDGQHVRTEQDSIVAVTWGVHGTTPTSRLEEAEANARRIAAAPDMEAALEGLTNKWATDQPCFCLPTWDRREHMDRCLAARAALAKARGEGA